MSRFFVVLDELKDWSPYYPSRDVISFDDYLLSAGMGEKTERVRLINLCRSYRYLGTGYYCSLLAEARGHNVLPSVRTLSELSKRSVSSIQWQGLDQALAVLPAVDEGQKVKFCTWFGDCLEERYQALCREVFERFPVPILEVTLQYKGGWRIGKIQAVGLKNLRQAEEQEGFARSFEAYSSKMWRAPKARKHYRYDLAILVDPNEKLPPSNEMALRKFVRAAEQLGICAERVGKKDYSRLAEYDGLFIRETTSVDHHTFRFAKKAEAEGLVVIDDSNSILRCTNKIFLADLLLRNKVPIPRTEFLRAGKEGEVERLESELGFPLVLKVPDGSFSRGVVKVKDADELKLESDRLLEKSALLLAQEFMYTDYDWRIGILDGRPLYACRYYMVNNHWQIYKHGTGGGSRSGGFDTIPTYEVPRKVIDAAVKACRLIGNGFYGVDLKQKDDRVVVIEVNDNPSIDAGVEDKYMKDGLYLAVMETFLHRMEKRGR